MQPAPVQLPEPHNMRASRSLLSLFAGVSLALHGLALWNWTAAPDNPPAQRNGNAGLHLLLSRAGSIPAPAQLADTAPVPATHRPAPQPGQQHDVSTSAAVPAETRETAPDRPELSTATQDADSGSATASTAQPAGNPLIDALQHAVVPYFHYPLLARRHGWEGTVQLGVRIAADGEILQVRIIRSSQHEVLDLAAVDSLGKVRRLTEVLARLNGHESDIVVPIEYRLTDS